MSDAPRDSLTHLDEAGSARMVDVGAKQPTAREAVAEGFVVMQPGTLELLLRGDLPKGEALGTARVAGIQAAKRCAELIPLCHPLPLEAVEVRFEPVEHQEGKARLRIEASARVTAKTGVEMEALAAVSVAALTIYDMSKAVDRNMRIDGVRVIRKCGGRHDLRSD